MKIYKAVIKSYGEILSEDFFVRKDKAIKYLKLWLSKYSLYRDLVDDVQIDVIERDYSIKFIDNRDRSEFPVYIEIVWTSDNLLSLKD